MLLTNITSGAEISGMVISFVGKEDTFSKFEHLWPWYVFLLDGNFISFSTRTPFVRPNLTIKFLNLIVAWLDIGCCTMHTIKAQYLESRRTPNSPDIMMKYIRMQSLGHAFLALKEHD